MNIIISLFNAAHHHSSSLIFFFLFLNTDIVFN